MAVPPVLLPGLAVPGVDYHEAEVAPILLAFLVFLPCSGTIHLTGRRQLSWPLGMANGHAGRTSVLWYRSRPGLLQDGCPAVLPPAGGLLGRAGSALSRPRSPQGAGRGLRPGGQAPAQARLQLTIPSRPPRC